MVSILGRTNIMEYIGLSSDTKPTDATNGSAFVEMDTGDVYVFDASSVSWIKM